MARNRRTKRLRPLDLRLTLAGWLFLAVSTLVGMAAVRTQTALLYILFGAMLGAVLVSAILSRRIVLSQEVRREAPERAWQHQTVHLGYYLRNRGRWTCLGLELSEDAPEGIESVAGYCVQVSPGATFRSGSRFTADRRGRIRLTAMRLTTVFPFGLVRAIRRLPRNKSLLIWPARGRLKRRLLYSGAAETSLAAPSQASGGQDEFFGLREYRPGDNPRWIHWRRSATRSAPVVREMARPLPEVLWVVLDTYRPDLSDAALDEMERAVRFAATLVDYAFTRGYQAGLALVRPDGPAVLPPAPGRGTRQAILDTLATVKANPDLPLAGALRRLRRDQLLHCQAVVITPGPAAALRGQPLNVLKAACRRLLIIDRDKLPGVFDERGAPAGEAGEPPPSGEEAA